MTNCGHSVDIAEPGRMVDYLHALTPYWWAVAVVFFGVGDLITTGMGLYVYPETVIEVGPLATVALETYGPAAMVPLKLLTLGLGYILWRVVPAPHDVGVPLGLAALGVFVTLRNAYLLSVAN